MQFFFSIIIPVYNCEDYLPHCLDSIFKQKFCIDEVQVIVVNDGSPRTNECDEIINAYKNKLNINYLKLETNKGTHVARKKGVETVNSEYFLFVDPDDYLEKKALKSIYEDIQKNGDVDYLEFNFFQLRYGRLKFKDSFLLPRDANVNVIDEKIRDGGHHWEMFNKCFKTSFAKPIYKEMPENYIFYAEDYYQICILDHFAKSRRILQKYLYVYVIGTGISNIQFYTKEKLRKMLLSTFNFNKNLIAFYRKEGKEEYIARINQNTMNLYFLIMKRSNLQDFIECCKEIVDDSTLEKIFEEHSNQNKSPCRNIKSSNKIFTMFAKIKRYLKRRFRK